MEKLSIEQKAKSYDKRGVRTIQKQDEHYCRYA
jgi:hypothetical protein